MVDNKPIDGVSHNQALNFKENCIIYIEEFAENTSIHGVRYLAERRRSKYEKIWWLIMFAILLYFCAGMVGEVYKKFDDPVVFISYDRKPTSVSEIPFPAITICPEIKTNPAVFNFTKKYLEYFRSKYSNTSESSDLLEGIALICTLDVYEMYTGLREVISNETLDFLIETVYPFNKIFVECQWMKGYDDCDKFFSPIFTEDGICFTFNMLPTNQIFKDNLVNELSSYSENFSAFNNKSFLWSQDHMYPKVVPENVFPRRVSEASSKMLHLELLEDKLHIDYLCNGLELGYKVVVHNPRDIPNVFADHFKLSFNKQYDINIKPRMLTISKGLKEYSPKYRQCYNNAEKKLSFFQYYSQKNCELECLTNYTLELCECVSFYMPKNVDTKICGPGKIECMESAKVKYSSLQMTTGLYSAESKGESAESKNLMCECLPECNSLNYEIEIRKSDYQVQPIIQRLSSNITELKTIQASNLNLKFKEMQFVKGKRKLLYGFPDLLANCGGLFSLFTGFSLISLVEFIYFCTLRMFCNFKRYGVYFWSGKKEA